MRLHVTRSKHEKTKLLGGAQTFYSLRLLAEISEAESEILRKYKEEQLRFHLPEDFHELRQNKDLDGPHGIDLPSLLTGAEFSCKFLAQSFCALPELILAQYEGLLGRIRAREAWEGEETLTAEY